MNQTLKGVLLGLFIALTPLFVWRVQVVHDWKANVDQRGFVTERAGTFLFGPSGVVDAKGNDMSRQQLLDAYLVYMVKNHPEWGLTFKK
jgi:hypothetical protein